MATWLRNHDCKEIRVADHRFKLGQHVRLSHGLPARAVSGMFEVIRLMPETQDGERHYRIKGPDNVERAVRESQLLSGLAG
jgi:hypothetical protein